MKRPSEWPLHFALYPAIFGIYPIPIPTIVQEISKTENDMAITLRYSCVANMIIALLLTMHGEIILRAYSAKNGANSYLNEV